MIPFTLCAEIEQTNRQREGGYLYLNDEDTGCVEDIPSAGLLVEEQTCAVRPLRCIQGEARRPCFCRTNSL